MSSSYTVSDTFTITHARHIASRIAGDLRLLWLYYGEPSEAMIENYLEEVSQVLAKGYLDTFEIGFRRDGRRVVSLFYTVESDGTLSDSRSGGVPRNAEVSRATQFSYLTYSQKWRDLSQVDRDAFRAALPIARTPGASPTDGAGYWTTDRSYSAGGAAVQRRTFNPL
jgi:hypothetical protein